MVVKDFFSLLVKIKPNVFILFAAKGWYCLTLLHSEWPKLHRVLAILSAIGLNKKVKGTVHLKM